MYYLKVILLENCPTVKKQKISLININLKNIINVNNNDKDK